MPDLEERITAWREQMAASGITSPQVLDELESHLRDDVEAQQRSGIRLDQSFNSAVERLGQAAVLECEFEKVGETKEAARPVKNALLTLAGIPNHYLNESMNTSSTNIEPRWATYLKGAAFLAPAVILWAMSVIFLIPKLEQIAAHAGGYPLPAVIRIMISLTSNGLLICSAIVVALVFLEWRSKGWPRYRRVAVGFGTFLFNAVVLISIFMMVVAAVLVAPSLMQHAR